MGYHRFISPPYSTARIVVQPPGRGGFYMPFFEDIPMDFNSAKEAFNRLFENKMTDEEAKTLLFDLYNRGENADEIAAAAEVMRSHCLKLTLPDSLQEKVIDVVGTGGDKSGSFNISTTVSIVLASLECFVAKHGNRSITSKSGSADVLEQLGINLNLNPEQQVKMLEDGGFCFMFAQCHHPAMKYIMPIRKGLDHRTIFNILGPLTNPAGASKQLIGVFSKTFISKMAHALEKLDSQNVMVVSSKDGLDEISIGDVTCFAHLQNGSITEGEIDPANHGISLAPLEAIKGGDARENAQILYDLLKNETDQPKRDIVLLNAGAALYVEGRARDIQDGIEMAKEAIDSGNAFRKIQQLADISSKL